MSLSKCSRLVSTSSLILRQREKKATLKIFTAPRSWFKKNDLFQVDNNFDRNKIYTEKATEKSGGEKEKMSTFKFIGAVILSSSMLIGSFFLFKWQLKSLLAKEDEAKGGEVEV